MPQSKHNLATAKLLEKAIALHQSGDLRGADQTYTQVLQNDPENPNALRLAGIVARELGDLEKSIRLLTASIEMQADQSDSHCELALSLMAAGHLMDAQEALQQAVEIDPYSMKALANLGALCQLRGHVEHAIELHGRVLELDPEDVNVHSNLAKALSDAGRGEEAVNCCQEALKRFPDHPFLLSTKGSVLCDLERYDEAIDCLTPLSEATTDDMALVNLSFAQVKKNQLDGARNSLQKAMAINPNNARAVSDYAVLLVDKTHNDEALDLCESFLTRHPGERMVLAAYGHILQERGYWEDSQHVFDFDIMISEQRLKTPVGFSSQKEFNDALAAYIVNHSSVLSNPTSKSTTGGRQTGELNPKDHPATRALEGLLREAITQTIADLRSSPVADQTLMATPPDHWTLRMWGTVLETGGYQAPHIHPLGWMSGVYYAQVPEDMNPSGNHSGYLEFGHLPDKYNLNIQPETRSIKPQPGMLVLFPSYFYHRTIPFSCRDARISVAFDLVPTAIP